MNGPHSWIIAVLVVIALILVGWLVARAQQERQSRRLRTRFGREYGHVVEERGDSAKAEAELRARERRVERLHIVPLAPADAQRFDEAWRQLQTRFVDDPGDAVGEADGLVRDLMVTRGYPMADFERRAADISVDHPSLVEAYRSAHAIAVSDRRGEASTEDLRQAVIYYRELFEELLEVRESKARVTAAAEPPRRAARP
jgi:hypothetical protein